MAMIYNSIPYFPTQVSFFEEVAYETDRSQVWNESGNGSHEISVQDIQGKRILHGME
mgnify:CR=1 FL=1